MTLYYVALFILALAIAAPFVLRILFPHKIELPEIAISIVGSILIASSVVIFVHLSTPTNVELLHGRVIDKRQVKVSCSHSYPCNPRQVCSGTGSTRSCYTVWSTCYRHSNDYDWRVFHDAARNGYLNIDRIDSRGTKEPPRFTSVLVGEPFTKANVYEDYIALAPNSLHYRKNVDVIPEYQRTIPRYPSITDLYRSNLILTTHATNNVDLVEMNNVLRNRLIRWGNKHQVNLIVMFTQHDRAFIEYLRNDWKNGRKNDAVILLNIDDENNVRWADIFSWSKNEYFNSIMRAQLSNMEKFTIDNFFEIVDNNIEHYVRMPMSEFKQLKWDREFSISHIIAFTIFQLIFNLGILLFIYHNDINNINQRRRY